MTSKKDVYTWIADYACKHRLEDIISDVFKDIDGEILSYCDISHINLKNALVWMTVKNDCHEEFEEAITAVDSLLDEAYTSNSLEMFVRLSLGLRLKDLYHSLPLPSDKFEKKIERHFPGSKFQLDKNYLPQVFSDRELDDFQGTVADVCKYFRALGRNEEQKMNLIAIYPQSHFGIKLSESLKNLTQGLFDKLSLNQPLNKLEQIVKFGVGNFRETTRESSAWHEWLIDRLSGVRILDDDMVRNLMTSLQWHEAVGPGNNPNGNLAGGRKADIKRKLMSSADITKPFCGRQVKEVILRKNREHSDELLSECDDNSSLDLDDLSFVPSSEGEQDIWIRKNLFGDIKSKCSGNYSVPNLQQFLKQGGIRGCVVRLSRI